jgi:hypothetical protein
LLFAHLFSFPTFNELKRRMQEVFRDMYNLRRQEEGEDKKFRKGGDLALEGLKRHLEMVQNIPTKDAPYGKDIYGNPKNSMGWTLATHYNYLNK